MPSAVQKAYVTAVRKVTPLAAKDDLGGAPLATTLTKTASDYGRLVAAGRANKPATLDARLRQRSSATRRPSRARSPSSRHPIPTGFPGIDRGVPRYGGVHTLGHFPARIDAG